MSLPIIMHVNYCEQGQTLEEICYKAVDSGFDGVEFRHKRWWLEEDCEDYLDEIAGAISGSGLKQVIFGYPCVDLMFDDKAKREAAAEDAIRFYRLASERFKLGICNAFTGGIQNPDGNIPWHECRKHGSAIASEEHWKWAVDGFKSIARLAEELDFRFAFETHMGYLHDLPETSRKLADLINSPAVGVNLDYGNIVYFNAPPSIEETLAAIGNKLYYVHLKNSIDLNGNVRLPAALGEGDINHRRYLKLLKESGYCGPICIEAPRSGDREWYVRQDMAYIKSVIEDIG